jgi:hypothetical protein
MEQFRYLGTTSTNQDSIREEIKNKLKSGNACYHSVQNLLSYGAQPEYIKCTLYRTIISHIVLCEPETLSLTVRQKPMGKRLLGITWRRCENNIKTNFEQVGLGIWNDRSGSEQGQVASCCEYGNKTSRSLKCAEFLHYLRIC